MDRLKGFGSFVFVAAAVLMGLRLLHLSVPIVFPQTRQGPIAITSLDEVRRQVGFAPIIPAYRPATLGSQPASMSVQLGPTPTFAIVWREGDQYLSVTQRQGGSKPGHPPFAGPLAGVTDSTWWMEGSRSRLIVARGGFWMELETSLPERELRRFADTLAPY
jgi:hypothetical protein